VADKKGPKRNLPVGDLLAVDIENFVITSPLCGWRKQEVETRRRGDEAQGTWLDPSNNMEGTQRRTPGYFNADRPISKFLACSNISHPSMTHNGNATWSQSNWTNLEELAEAQ
jgi:hypothetical protein